MKLYKISRPDRANWDEYIAAIVAAKNENEARTILSKGETWIDPEDVIVELIGTAIKGTKSGVILSDFKAG